MFRNGLEPWHIIVLALVLILLFGSKRLPDAARGLGRSLRIFKSEMKSMSDDDSTDAPTDKPADPAAEKAADASRPETPPRVDG